MNSDTILCFSGGIDSTVAWYYLGKPKCIYFDCSNYSEIEKKTVLSINPDTIISNALDLRQFEKGENAYILHRNLLMASIASNYASNVVIAGVKDDHVSDKNPAAFNKMSKFLSETSNKKINIISPFWKITKSEVVKWFLNNIQFSREIIHKSTSCYSNKSYCGKCPSCFRKACALWDNGIPLLFYNNKMMENYYLKALDLKYEESRCKSIIKFVEEHNGYIC